MSNAFLAALASKSPATTATKAPTSPSKAITPKAKVEAPNIPTIELILDEQRISVTFLRKPTDEVCQRFRKNLWKSLDCIEWWNDDTAHARKCLNDWFNADIEIDNNFVITPDYFKEPEKEKEETTLSPEYVKFKKQVNELMEKLKVDAADLMLLAIDNLHKVKFG